MDEAKARDALRRLPVQLWQDEPIALGYPNGWLDTGIDLIDLREALEAYLAVNEAERERLTAIKAGLTDSERVINAVALRCLDYEDPTKYIDDVVEWMRSRITSRWIVERESRDARRSQ